MLDAKKRYFLYGGVALAAGALGVGTALRRHQLGGASSLALDALWASEFESPLGAMLRMSDYRDHPLVINFWATWCAPCVEEMPLIDAFYRQNSSNGWKMIGLAVDQPSRVRQFLTQFPVTYDIGLAGLNGTELGKSLGNEQSGLPFTIVLDAQGRPKHRKLGKLTEEDIKSWLV